MDWKIVEDYVSRATVVELTRDGAPAGTLTGAEVWSFFAAIAAEQEVMERADLAGEEITEEVWAARLSVVAERFAPAFIA